MTGAEVLAVRFTMDFGAHSFNVDLRASNGVTVLVGPNGAGKSTILRTIAGAHHPTLGRILLGSRALFDGERGVNLPPECRRVAYIPQGSGLLPHLSVSQNVAFAVTQGAPDPERVLAQLDELGCAELAHRFPAELSGGETQRVALARALIGKPELILLDEPLAALDVLSRQQTRKYLKSKLLTLGVPTVIVTHDPKDLWALDANVALVEAGTISWSGNLRTAAAHTESRFLAALFESSPALPND